MDTLHQRLLKAFDYLRDKGLIHTQTQFAEAVGKSQSQINNAFRDVPKRCTLGLMKAIATAFPDVLSTEYLLTGEGDIAAPDKSSRPHYDAKACAGFMSGVAEGEMGVMHPHIPGIKDYDFTIMVEGDSMLPRIESGDLLACRRSEDRANPPIGKICVIDSREGAAVKVIAGSDGSHFVLHSLNPNYEDYPIDIDDVLGIAEVVGQIRQY